MALIKCPECQKEISEVAKSCPNCGYSLINKKKKTNKQRIVGIAIILLLIFVNLVGNAGTEAIPPSIIFGIIGLYLIIKKPKTKMNENIASANFPLYQENNVFPILQQRVKKKKHRYLIPILIIITGFLGMIMTIQNKRIKEDFTLSTDNAVFYTDLELINLEGHPKAFDSFYKAVGFYSTVEDNKVEITNTFKKISVYNYTPEKDHFIYMNNGASREGYIDEIIINFGNSDLCENITLDDVIKIAISYMPMDIFNEYYTFKRAFIYSYNNKKSYHYAWRINDKGIEYHNNGHPQLRRNYGFCIIHSENTNEFIIKINSWARDIDMGLTEHSPEWFNEYTEPWNIDLSNYIE